MAVEDSPTDRLRSLHDGLASGRFMIAPLSDGTGVLLNLRKREILTFNETGMLLVRALKEGATSTSALARRLETEFAVTAAEAERDVASFAARLANALAVSE